MGTFLLRIEVANNCILYLYVNSKDESCAIGRLGDGGGREWKKRIG